MGRKAAEHIFTWWGARAGGRKHSSVPQAAGLWLATAALLVTKPFCIAGPYGGLGEKCNEMTMRSY